MKKSTIKKNLEGFEKQLEEELIEIDKIRNGLRSLIKQTKGYLEEVK